MVDVIDSSSDDDENVDGKGDGNKMMTIALMVICKILY